MKLALACVAILAFRAIGTLAARVIVCAIDGLLALLGGDR